MMRDRKQSTLDNPLSRSLAKSRRALYITLAVSTVFMFAVTAWAVFRFNQLAPGFVWPIVIVMAAMWLAMIAITFFATRRSLALPERFEASSGMLCPACFIALESIDDESDCACPKCRMLWTRVELRQFWETVGGDPMAAGRWLMERRADEVPLPLFVRVFMKSRGSVTWIIGFNCAMWLGLGLIFAAVQGKSLFAGAFTYVHMAVCMSGFMTLAAGWKRRVGDEARCASCGYIREPDAAAANCPECGSQWNNFGGITRGEVQRRPAVMILGAVLLLAGVALIGAPFFAPGWRLSITPTSVIIREVTQTNSFTMTEWAELNTRTLSETQRLRLFEGLLDKRLRKGYYSADADNWIVAQIALGGVPQPLIDRYYREEMDSWLLAPHRMSVGEQAEVAIASRYRNAATNNPKSTVLFRAYFVDDVEQPPMFGQAQPLEGVPGIMFGRQRYHVGNKDAGPGTAPSFIVDAAKPGPLRIRAELWIVYLLPGTIVTQQRWMPDGTPLLPAGTLWHERRAIEHVIDVVP